MLLQGWSFSCGVLLSRSSSHSTYYCGNFISYPPKTTFSSSSSSSSSSKAATTVQVVCASVGINEFAEIVHNKVLIAAAASAAIGQLSKPFTSTFLYGNRNNNNFDFVKAAFQAGGFPSSHSSAAVATAMSLGIERGFSDAIFGLAVVYASLVMYDAQGVRREVGIHAKALNRVLVQNFIPSKDVDDTIDSRPRISFSKRENFEPISLEEADSFSLKHRNAKILLGSENRKGQIGKLSSSSSSSDAEGETEKVNSWDVPFLKESVGHNEFEVIAGALLGLFVCLVVYNIT